MTRTIQRVLQVAWLTTVIIAITATQLAGAPAAATETRSEASDRDGNADDNLVEGGRHDSIARAVDQSILSELEGGELLPADDYTFLRRAYLDIVGRPATPAEITRFGLQSAPDKRDAVVVQLLDSGDYATNWTRYWRDALFARATNVRSGLVRPAFEQWMEDELSSGAGWDEIVSQLLTATGPVNENGATALIFAHEGVSEEIAAEASRLFTGIQIQCANCHDHPWDRWKRDQFHEFAAFFPRVSVRRERGSENMFDYEIASVDMDRRAGPGLSLFLLNRLDRNRDGLISESEARNSPLAGLLARNKERIDSNGDGQISIEEIMTAQPPQNRPGQGALEHFMPDLLDPGTQGQRVDPRFFVNDRAMASGMSDLQRRSELAGQITASSNPWFARAVVNRMWYEMTGTAFYLPVDDIGPDREVRHEQALELLCQNFVKHDHDLKWLIRTIAATQVYQRGANNHASDFAKCEPMRLRSDQAYAALTQALNVTDLPLRFTGRSRGPHQNRQGNPGRDEFARIFGFDPTTSRDDLTRGIPEALFLMNSRELQQLISSPGPQSTVGRLLWRFEKNDDLLSELYLVSLGREPNAAEMATASDFVNSASSRREGVEDLLWALINSPEFVCKP